MVAADDQDRVVVDPDSFQFLDQNTKSGIEGGNFAQVVGKVFANHGDIGKVGWQFALKIIGIDSPQRLAAAGDPLAVRIGWSKPVTDGLVAIERPIVVGIEERADIAANLVEQCRLGRLVIRVGHRGLRETIEAAPVTFGTCAPPRRADRRRVYQGSKPCRCARFDNPMPPAATDSLESIGPKSLPARSLLFRIAKSVVRESNELRHGVHEGALTKARVNSKPSSATRVKIRCGDVVVDSTWVKLAIDARVLAPVVSKRHHDMRTIIGLTLRAGANGSQQEGSRTGISPIADESFREVR